MASASSQTTSSAASNSSPTSWDVFLSFRGTDTRNKFTSHLYAALDCHGIRTFKDDPELRNGDVISEALLEAIRRSKSYIVVFSENYASSPWCLDELVEIYNSHKTMARLVIPVFCNIDPSVVRHQIGSFKEAFEKHEIRFATQMDKVKKWRLALTKVADFSGTHVSQNRSEADVIIEIVDEILLKINPKILHVAKYPVGLNSRVKDLTTLLSTGTEGVIRFGIYGMGGVGKTTFAKALYNQLLLGSFKDSCFLANCREVSGTTKGLVSLQQKLINDVLKSKKKVRVDNVDHGIQLIRARICSKKLLVVIDDLGHHKQFESLVGPFAPGSIVIITTRSEDLLETIDVEPIYRYKVNELGEDKSLTLFTKHAFGNDEPSSNLMVLAEEILCHAGGLPLALEVFGSNLYKRSEAGWKHFINKLQRNPDSTIQQRLIISLDVLESDDPMLKKMFLDIACFLNGSPKRRAVKLLESYYSDAEYDIGILKKRCLLNIDDSNKLRMHDLLRDMGKEVSRNNSPNEPGKHSRLWEEEDICDVLKKQKGTEVIEAIIPCNFGHLKPLQHISFTVKSFKRLINLRFLYLYDVNITGSFEQTLEDLRWLTWSRCPLKSFPSKFYLQKLVFLALPCSELRTMKLNMVFKNLKDLDMSGSEDLTTTPDFTKLPCLETLNLSGCRSLKEVHISNGVLGKLVYLNLSNCVKLKCLPDTLFDLGALEFLYIDGCKSLKALPVELGNIKSLKELRAGSLTVSKLPESIGRLCKLVKLDLSSNHKLETFPDTICNLRALEVLKINQCRSLRALPVELGKLESLKVLCMRGLTVSEIPNSIGHLHELAILNLDLCKNLRNLPDSMGSLRSLEELTFYRCEKLQRKPEDFGDLIKSKVYLEAPGPENYIENQYDLHGRLDALCLVPLDYEVPQYYNDKWPQISQMKKMVIQGVVSELEGLGDDFLTKDGGEQRSTCKRNAVEPSDPRVAVEEKTDKVALAMVRPRSKSDRERFPPNNVLLMLCGAGLLWMGWSGFNGGAPYAANTASSIAVLNTNICAATSLLVWTCLDVFYFGKPSVVGAVQGMMTGLVCITPGAGLVQSWAAIVMGILSGSVPWYTMMILHKKSILLQKVDDTLGVFHTHAVAGLLGGLLTGLLAEPDLCRLILPVTDSRGAFYGGKGGVQFVKQLVAALFVIGWNIVSTTIILLVIKIFIPLRMPDEELNIGDDAAHGEEAYALWGDGERYDPSKHGNWNGSVFTEQSTPPAYGNGLAAARGVTINL